MSKRQSNKISSKVYNDNRYVAEVIKWLDGDTVELSLDLGMSVSVRAKFRLGRIDAPEVKKYSGVTNEEKALGIELRGMLSEKIPPGKLIIAVLSKKGKYGRYIVEIWDEDEDIGLYNLNDWLLNEGLVEGVVY